MQAFSDDEKVLLGLMKKPAGMLSGLFGSGAAGRESPAAHEDAGSESFADAWVQFLIHEADAEAKEGEAAPGAGGASTPSSGPSGVLASGPPQRIVFTSAPSSSPPGNPLRASTPT